MNKMNRMKFSRLPAVYHEVAN
uniref:Uncharacterized protein n=1 Tax=Anguilla anguilla TaxID=7936 RepID=A0A0E9UNT0_ANGAN